REEQAAEVLRLDERVLGLVGEEVGLEVDVEEVDAAPPVGAAALGLPLLVQGELGAGDVVDLVDALVVLEQLVARDVRGTGEEVDLRLDDVPQAVQVEEVAVDGVVDLPEGGGDAHAGAGEQAVLGGAVGRVGVNRVAAEDVRHDAELAGGEGV